MASFEAEAEKTNWVAALLNTEEKVEGMLSVLLKSNPATFKMVGRKQKVPMKQVMLTTTQTIALVRVGGLNDFRMKKVRSYINHMAKANIELASKEIERIDIQVGLHRTKEVVFGSYVQ